MAETKASIRSLQLPNDNTIYELAGEVIPDKGEIFNDYDNNEASEPFSHSEGENNKAHGQGTHVEGVGNIAKEPYSHVQGKFNLIDEKDITHYAHIVGNGEPAVINESGEIISPEKHSNAHTLDWDGNAWYAGNIKVGGTSAADGT